MLPTWSTFGICVASTRPPVAFPTPTRHSTSLYLTWKNCFLIDFRCKVIFFLFVCEEEEPYSQLMATMSSVAWRKVDKFLLVFKIEIRVTATIYINFFFIFRFSSELKILFGFFGELFAVGFSSAPNLSIIWWARNGFRESFHVENIKFISIARGVAPVHFGFC